MSSLKLFDDAVARFAAYLLTTRGRSRSTVVSYQRDLEQFGELAGVKQLSALNRRAVLDWLDALSKRELAPSSRARKLSALRSFVDWAAEYGLLESNPIPREVATPRSLYLPHALSEAEITTIISAAHGDEPSALRDRAILETLYATGMRVGELTALKLVDLHLGEGFLIVTGKGNKQRLVPIGHCARSAVSAYLGEAGDGPRRQLCRSAGLHAEVFLTRRGPMSRSTAFRVVKKYAAQAGITQKVSPHTFRHSCASHLLARGMDLRLVQELLGHASLSTTEIYTHIERSRIREVYEKAHPMA
jgi:integrase/recombinase XerD